MKRLLIVVLVMVLTGCWGYSARDNEMIGQVKKVEKVTPMICPDYKAADLTLGVMKNGTGSLSKEDVWIVIADKQQEAVFKEANKTGALVKVRYDEKRCGGNFWICTPDLFALDVEIIK